MKTDTGFKSIFSSELSLKQKRHRITRRLTYYLTRLFMFLSIFLPYAAIKLLAKILSFFSIMSKRQKQIILANLAIALPDKSPQERYDIMKRSLYSNMLSYLEFLWVYHKPQRIDQIVDIDEELFSFFEHSASEGGIFICPHIGNWELGNLYANKHLTKLFPVARYFRDPKMNNLMIKARNLTGGEVITGKGGAKEIFKVLKNKQFVLMLVDQNVKPKEGGFFIDFFGLPVTTSRAPASFAVKTKKPIIMGYCVRINGRLTAKFETLKIDTSKTDDLEKITRAYNEHSEKIILKYPDQYLWMYERFRYIPPDYQGDATKFPFYAKVMKKEDL